MMQHPTKVPSFLLINIVNIWCGYRLLASLSLNSGLCWVGLLLFSMSASHTVGCGFTSHLGHIINYMNIINFESIISHNDRCSGFDIESL